MFSPSKKSVVILLLTAAAAVVGIWAMGEKGKGSGVPSTVRTGEKPSGKPKADPVTAETLDRDLARLNLEADPETKARMLDALCEKLRGWTLLDPAAASDWAAKQAKTPGFPPEIIHTVASAWATLDMVKSMQWVCQMPNHEPFEPSVLSVGYQVAASDPRKLLEVAVSLPLGERGGRNDLVIHAVNNWAATAPEEALAWARQMADPILRPRVLSALAITWSERDPQAAANLALTDLPAGKLQNEAIVGIVQRWVQKDAAKVADWVVTFPAGEVRQAALDNVVKLWAEQDAEATGQWLNRMDVGETRDAAVGSFVAKVAAFAPEVAAVWAESIHEAGQRDRQMEAAGRAWLAVEEEPARAWISRSSLPDAAKTRLLQAGQ